MAITVNDKNLGHATAYAYAKSKGYTGTEEEFAILMASYGTVAEAAEESRQAAEEAQEAAEQAQSKAETAQGSAESAQAKAETAQGKAEQAQSAAETARNTAQTKASEASQSATTAASSASAASGSATAAAGSASTASTKATEAASSATAAADSKTAAETAQGKAEDAQEAAEQAAQSVTESAEQIEANKDDIAEINKYDDVCKIIKITATNTTLGDVATMLNQVNTAGDHVFFDMSALGVMMYLCTIFIDTTNNVYKVFDLVSGRYAEGTYDSTMLLTMATAQANGLAVQSQIDYLQGEIDELGGKSVVANWDVLADMIQAGTSTDIIKAGDTIPINWIASVLGTTTSGLTVTCSDPDKFINGVGEAEAKDYLFVYDGSNWTYNGDSITLADFGLSVSGTPATGEVMNIKTTVTERSYTFVDYDPDNVVDATVDHSWMLEQTYAPDTKAYCSYQALFAIYKGKRVPTGDYHLRCRIVSKSAWVDCYIHVTAEMGSDEYIVQARSNGYLSSQSFTNEDGVTVTGAYTINTLTPNIYGTRTAAAGALTIAYAKTAGVTYTELTDLNVDPNDPVVFTSSMVFDKCTLGNNIWEQSQISEWLNDDTAAKASVEPMWMLYVPNAYNLGAGFLYGIDPRVKKYIQTANVKWVAGYSSEYTQGQLYTTQQKVFLLSMKEMSFNLQTTEGDVTDLYDEYTGGVLTNDAVAARAKYNKAGGTLNNYRWSRSAISGDAYSSRNVTSTGASYGSSASGAYYYAPAFIFGKSSIA